MGDARRAPSWLGPALVVALAAAALAAPMPAPLIDRYYARIYPAWQGAVTWAIDWLPFAPFDLWLVVVLVVVGVSIRRAVKRARSGALRPAGAGLLRVLVIASVLYLWFLASWGLNYRRTPLTESGLIRRERVTPEAVRTLAERTVSELNRLHEPAWAAGWPEWREVPAILRPALPHAAQAVGLRQAFTPTTPRVSLLQPYFRWASIEGMTDPFLFDVIVNDDLLPMERPAMVAHEWGHVGGLARESEASYFGWRLCQQGDTRLQYSGWLFLYGYVMNSVDAETRRPMLAALAVGPRRDLRAIAARAEHAVPVVRDAAWQAYDRYLKSNRVAEGVRSYDDVLVLILGDGVTLK